MIQFSLAVEPLPQSRPRFGRGRAYELPKMTAYKAAISKAASSAMKDQQPLTAALSCRIKLFRKFKATSRRFGDTDNLAKSILDACNGVIFADDAQIMKLIVEKCQGTPCVEVEITEVERK